MSGSGGDKGRFRPQTNREQCEGMARVNVWMLKLQWRKDRVDWKWSAETVQSTLSPKTSPDWVLSQLSLLVNWCSFFFNLSCQRWCLKAVTGRHYHIGHVRFYAQSNNSKISSQLFMFMSYTMTILCAFATMNLMWNLDTVQKTQHTVALCHHHLQIMCQFSHIYSILDKPFCGGQAIPLPGTITNECICRPCQNDD